MPAPYTITACILARNEGHRIEDALKSLQGWTVQIIVIDNDSKDDTAAIARRYGALVLFAPTSVQFDGIRNLAIEHAIGELIFFLDADERVPPALGQALQRLVRERGDEFEAMCIPFKHYFCGKWMQHSGWWPGYTRPQLLKKGRFQYGARLHSGVQVDGRTLDFPADDPNFAIVHYSYDDLNHYMTKLNRYTDGEAESSAHRSATALLAGSTRSLRFGLAGLLRARSRRPGRYARLCALVPLRVLSLHCPRQALGTSL